MEEDQGPDWEQQRLAEEERMRTELDCLKVVHLHGLEGTAETLACSLGLSKQWKQERATITQEKRHAAY